MGASAVSRGQAILVIPEFRFRFGGKLTTGTVPGAKTLGRADFMRTAHIPFQPEPQFSYPLHPERISRTAT